MSHDTVIRALLARAEGKPDAKAFSFAQRDVVHSTLRCGELVHKCLVAAGSLADAGVRRGDRVIVCLPTSEDLLIAMFGVLLAGGVCVPVYPLSVGQGLERWRRQVRAVTRVAQVRGAVVGSACRAEMAAVLAERLEDTFALDPSQLKHAAPASPCSIDPADLAFIQFTSGTTREPRGAAISHGALAANVRAIIAAIGLDESVVSVSWLPPYHDMGLVGHVFTPAVCGAHQVLLPTNHFLVRPVCWLKLLSKLQATQTTSPNTGYSMCVHRIAPEAREGLDLSHLRQALVGAEPVLAHTLQAFARAYEPFGFSPRAFRPVYGLAESTLAVTVGGVGAPAVDWIDREVLAEGRCAAPATPESPGAQSFVCVGRPVLEHEIRIVDEQGAACPPRCIGEIRVKGPSVMQGYFNDPLNTRGALHDGWLLTGDLGYVADGQLYVTGRAKELVIKAGMNYVPAELEAACEDEPRVRRGRVVAFGVANQQAGTEDIIVIAEARTRHRVERLDLAQRLTALITERAGVRPDKVHIVEPGVLSKTSSGKLQRARVRADYERGLMPGRGRQPRWLDGGVAVAIRGKAWAYAELGWSRARAWLNWR